MADPVVTLSRHRWTKSEDFGGGYYAPPEGAVATIDLRNLEQQATPGSETDASCVCLMAPSAKIDDSHVVIASGEPRGVQVTAKTLDPLVSALRLKTAPAGNTLAECIADLLLTHADPKGMDFCKPMIPTVQRQLEMWLGAKAHSRPFVFGSDAASNQVQSVLQENFRSLYAEVSDGKVDPVLLAKSLDYEATKLGISKSSKADWGVLMPADLRGEIDVLVPHDTTITDNFNRSNESPLASPWSNLSGTPTLTSNVAVGNASVETLSRYDSDLSSSDHYSQIDAATGVAPGKGCGPMARKDSSATKTYYLAWLTSDTQFQLFKCIANSFTQLGSTFGYTYSAPDTGQAVCNGSTISAFLNTLYQSSPGSSVISVTDSAISSGVRCGFRSFNFATGTMDNFEATDLAASTTRGMPFGQRGTAFNGGRCLKGHIA